jgi:hypothetical protein
MNRSVRAFDAGLRRMERLLRAPEQSLGRLERQAGAFLRGRGAIQQRGGALQTGLGEAERLCKGEDRREIGRSLEVEILSVGGLTRAAGPCISHGGLGFTPPFATGHESAPAKRLCRDSEVASSAEIATAKGQYSRKPELLSWMLGHILAP